MSTAAHSHARHLYQPTDELALRLAAIAAGRLTGENLKSFRDMLERFSERLGPNAYLETWLAAIDAGSEAVRAIFLDTGERGQVLRSCVSFRPFFQDDELRTLMNEHNRRVISAMFS